MELQSVADIMLDQVCFNPALFAEGKLKGAMKNEIICGKCGCAGPYVKIKEFPNKMDAQGKAKETWNRRVNDGKID